MCLSHYGHLNEYSHVLTQKSIALVKKKRHLKVCVLKEKWKIECLIYCLWVYSKWQRCEWLFQGWLVCIVHQRMYKSHRASEQLFLTDLRCSYTEQIDVFGPQLHACIPLSYPAELIQAGQIPLSSQPGSSPAGCNMPPTSLALPAHWVSSPTVASCQ